MRRDHGNLGRIAALAVVVVVASVVGAESSPPDPLPTRAAPAGADSAALSHDHSPFSGISPSGLPSALLACLEDTGSSSSEEPTSGFAPPCVEPGADALRGSLRVTAASAALTTRDRMSRAGLLSSGRRAPPSTSL